VNRPATETCHHRSVDLRGLLEWADLALSGLGLVALLSSPFVPFALAERRAHARLRRLAAGISPEAFDDILGPPMFVSDGGARRTYVDDRFLVQATADDDGVTNYAVTTRRRGFRPKIPFPNGGWSRHRHPPKSGRLGRTTFADAWDEQIEAKSRRGARRFGYIEWAYLANPGNYQTIGLGISDGGPIVQGFDELISLFPAPGDGGRSWTAPEAARDDRLQAFRHAGKPNMYIVTAAGVDIEPDVRWPGADQDEIRVLQERSSWRDRRRTRRDFEVTRRQMWRAWRSRR
jgi:hypothetical protein